MLSCTQSFKPPPPLFRQVYLDGAFTSSGYMPAVSPGQEFIFPVGSDDAVKVTARLPTAHEQNTGLLVSTGSKRTVTHLFTVRNAKKAAVEVVVRDRVPTSSHQDIKARSGLDRSPNALPRACNGANARRSCRLWPLPYPLGVRT